MFGGETILGAPPLPDLNHSLGRHHTLGQTQEITKESTATKEKIQTVAIRCELGFDVEVDSLVLAEIMGESCEHAGVQ